MLIKVPHSEASGNDVCAAVESIIADVSRQEYAGNLIPHELRHDKDTRSHVHVRFMLRVKNCRELPARASASGRRTNAANWDAHAQVMTRLFDKWPSMILVSALDTYTGRDSFRDRHGDTYASPVQHMGERAQFGGL